MKIGNVLKKEKKSQTVISETADAPKPFEVPEIQQVFKEHYPLLFPYSYAAIVEDEKKDLSYALLEPTLTPIDEATIKEVKDIGDVARLMLA